MIAHATNVQALRERRYDNVTMDVLRGELEWREVEYATTDLKDDLIALLEADDESEPAEDDDA